MADLLIDGVCNALYNEFGNDYEYYIDEIKQGLNKSCFFVSYVRNAQNRYINNRLRSENRISIQFIPTDDVSAEKRSEIANRLYTCLDCIDYGPDKLFGKEMQCEPLSDNMLNFQVSYNFFKKVVSDNIDEMNELRLNQIRGDLMKKTETKYTKEQLINSDVFSNKRDLLTALLIDGENYTVKETDELIKKYLKGKVK